MEERRNTGTRIKELRLMSKMTQKEFANFLNLPLRTVENWETGIRNPKTYIIELIEYKLKNEKIIK